MLLVDIPVSGTLGVNLFVLWVELLVPVVYLVVDISTMGMFKGVVN